VPIADRADRGKSVDDISTRDGDDAINAAFAAPDDGDTEIAAGRAGTEGSDA
jgi:hypothetical protein